MLVALAAVEATESWWWLWRVLGSDGLMGSDGVKVKNVNKNSSWLILFLEIENKNEFCKQANIKHLLRWV